MSYALKRFYLWTTDNDGPHFLPQCHCWEDVKERLKNENPEKFLFLELWKTTLDGGEDFYYQWKYLRVKSKGVKSPAHFTWKLQQYPETPKLPEKMMSMS